jgi:hypothetical protein
MAQTTRTGTDVALNFQSGPQGEVPRPRAGSIVFGFSYPLGVSDGFAAGYAAGFAAGTLSSSGVGLLISYTAQGALSADPELARWTPILVTFLVPVGYSPVIAAQIGTNSILTMLVYSDLLDGFQPIFADKSVIVSSVPNQTVNGHTGTEITMSILPNGGWTRDAVAILLYASLEILPA